MSNKRLCCRNLTRRELLKYAALGAVSAGLTGISPFAGCSSKGGGGEIKNVILISIDTLRQSHLGCYGYARPTSPVMDALASQSVLFENVYTPSPWTLPAHASLLTGLYPSRHGVKLNTQYLPDEAFTLAEVLKKHDFLTAAIVNFSFLSRKHGLDRGFDDFTYIHEQVKNPMPSKVGNEALDWLSKNRKKPFFLFLHFFDLHSDYGALSHYEKEFARPYDGIADGTTDQLMSFRRGEISLNHRDAQHLIDLYDAGIRQMDDGIKQVLTKIDETGLSDNTLIMVTSDHGEEFLDHGGLMHGRTHFEEVVQVPLIVRGPGLARGLRISDAVSLIDIVPTVLSLLNIKESMGFDGVDLSPVWNQPGTRLTRRFVFGEADWQNREPDIKRFALESRYKLHYDLLTKEMQLYDLASDENEQADLLPDHAARADNLYAELEKFMTGEKRLEETVSLSSEEKERLESLGYVQ